MLAQESLCSLHPTAPEPVELWAVHVTVDEYVQCSMLVSMLVIMHQ